MCCERIWSTRVMSNDVRNISTVGFWWPNQRLSAALAPCAFQYSREVQGPGLRLSMAGRISERLSARHRGLGYQQVPTATDRNPRHVLGYVTSP